MLENLVGIYLNSNGCFVNKNLCHFDKSLTPESMVFILFALVFSVYTFFVLKRKIKRPIVHFGLMGAGVLMFELFTAPMWNNLHLGRFGYYYIDISWILTACWTAMFLADVHLIDYLFPRKKEWQKLFLALIIPFFFTILGELLLVYLGIRSYAPEIIINSLKLIGGVPIEIIYYAPVFSTFIVCFYKFWHFQIQRIPLVPMRKKVTVRNFIISFVGIFMFELLIEPIVDNRNFPVWSYLYKDISFVRIGLWIALITVGTTFIDKLFAGYRQWQKYLYYIALISVLFYQLESWLITHGYRVYLESASANFSGFMTPISRIPLEIAFALVLYLALIIAFIRYWRIVWDNRL